MPHSNILNAYSQPSTTPKPHLFLKVSSACRGSEANVVSKSLQVTSPLSTSTITTLLHCGGRQVLGKGTTNVECETNCSKSSTVGIIRNDSLTCIYWPLQGFHCTVRKYCIMPLKGGSFQQINEFVSPGHIPKTLSQPTTSSKYRIADNIFGGQNIRGSAILRHFVGNIFVVGACTARKGRQGRFIRG